MSTAICSGFPGRIILVLLVLYLGGCATYSRQASSMRDNLLIGRADLARQTAEEKDQDQRCRKCLGSAPHTLPAGHIPPYQER